MWQDRFDGATGDVAGPHPLEEVKRRVADGSCSALSLDVSDTVLWRRVPRPADLFSILGARIRDRGDCPGWLSDACTVSSPRSTTTCAPLWQPTTGCDWSRGVRPMCFLSSRTRICTCEMATTTMRQCWPS